MVRVVRVVLVDDRMDHDSLFVDCESRVSRHCDPAFCLESVMVMG